jgi:predicted O-linked N-acetylglucosamine transferase (SPINDLY family)
MALVPPNRPASRAAQGSHAQAQAHQRWLAGQGHAKHQRWSLAIKDFEQACALRSDERYELAAAHALIKAGRNADALLRTHRLRQHYPNQSLAYSIESHALLALGRAHEALACFEQMPAAAERDHAHWIAYANALQRCERHADAIPAFMNALGGAIHNPALHYQLGMSFKGLGMKSQAAECVRTAVILGLGESEFAARGLLAFMDRETCDWPASAQTLAALREAVAAIPDATPLETSPFTHAVLVADPLEQLKVARHYALFVARGVKPLPSRPARALPQRLRVAYLSADFHQHATSQLMAQMLECHDRQTFDVTLLSTGVDDGSDMRRRIAGACEHFENLRGQSPEAMAQRVRALGIDILVDLKGATNEHSMAVFAHRPAPVQVNWLGFPGTTGAAFMDYIVGDPVVTPESAAHEFSEQIAQLPNCYQPNDAARALPRASTRAEWGVPEGKLLLCAFHQSYKISEEVFDLWCALLHARPEAVLWLLHWNLNVQTRLMAAAQARGIDPERLLFAPTLPPAEHLSRLACADIYLDAWPCNGHTTTGEALWVGVPVVTLKGPAFAQRVAASLLHTAGLADCVCGDPDSYRAQVLALAADAERRTAIRRHLQAQRSTGPLFDGARFARDIEALYSRMWARAVAGLPPGPLLAQNP